MVDFGDDGEVTAGDKAPPVVLRRKADEQGITTREAAAVINARWSLECDAAEVAKACGELEYVRHWAQWYVLPEQVEEIAGRIVQRRALWWQKRMVRGDVLAEVEGLVDGDVMVLSLPMERLDDGSRDPKDMRLFERLPLFEWPTARQTGWLELVSEKGAERPRYRLSHA